VTLQDLGNIGELVEATSASVNASYASINSRISCDKEFAALFLKGRRDLESLDDIELERFRAFVFAWQPASDRPAPD